MLRFTWVYTQNHKSDIGRWNLIETAPKKAQGLLRMKNVS